MFAVNSLFCLYIKTPTTPNNEDIITVLCCEHNVPQRGAVIIYVAPALVSDDFNPLIAECRCTPLLKKSTTC